MSPCAKVQIGDTTAIVCYSGPYTHLVYAKCPWCCLGSARTIHAFRFVHSGWCAPDMVCGRCGQVWSYDDEGKVRRTKDHERNRRIVREMRKTIKPSRLMPIPPDLMESTQ